MSFDLVQTYRMVIHRGKTESWRFMLGDTGAIVFKPVTAATQAAPCVITAPGHDLLPGWPYRIIGAKGMTVLGRVGYIAAKPLDADMLELVALNTLNQPAYTGGAVLQYEAPLDIAGATVVGGMAPVAGGANFDLAPYLSLDTASSSVDLLLPDSVTASMPDMRLAEITVLMPGGTQIAVLAPSPVQMLVGALP